MKIKNVKIKWTYPIYYYNVLKYKIASEQGLYQISRLFGKKETLLYIGIVKSSNRTFKERLSEHKYWLNKYRGKIKVRLGTIQKKEDLIISPQLIEDIESILIFESSPFENTQKTYSYSIDEDLQIKNIGYRGFLPKIICSCNH